MIKSIVLMSTLLVFKINAEVVFLKSQANSLEPQQKIKDAILTHYKVQDIDVIEILNREYCDYVNKWCDNRGFSFFKVQNKNDEVITIIVSYTENEIDNILINSDLLLK